MTWRIATIHLLTFQTLVMHPRYTSFSRSKLTTIQWPIMTNSADRLNYWRSLITLQSYRNASQSVLFGGLGSANFCHYFGSLSECWIININVALHPSPVSINSCNRPLSIFFFPRRFCAIFLFLSSLSFFIFLHCFFFVCMVSHGFGDHNEAASGRANSGDNPLGAKRTCTLTSSQIYVKFGLWERLYLGSK